MNKKGHSSSGRTNNFIISFSKKIDDLFKNGVQFYFTWQMVK